MGIYFIYATELCAQIIGVPFGGIDGATIVGGEGVICQEAPDADAMEQCKALGKALANA